VSRRLPPLPRARFDDGYGWMSHLRDGWQPIPGWGRDGWDLGDWPYAVVAHYDGEGVHGLGTYVEGDVYERSFATREERDAATDQIAALYWRLSRNGPDDLPPSDDYLGPHHRGPYTRARRDEADGL
jgi:hypothetical protein